MLDEEFMKIINASAENVNKPVDFTYRLYYNKGTGEPVAYSMEELEGDYVKVSKEQYHQGRYDLVVKDETICLITSMQYVRKLVPNTDGIACDKSNVLILDKTSSTRWKLKTKELL
jgi:hypothetical protein